MSFGFGGFGQNNQGSGFGAGSSFGGGSGGFGSGSTSSPFGGGGTGGSLFGSNNNTSSFGSGGGFGTQNQASSPFGAQSRPGGFGTGTGTGATGGSLFGGGGAGSSTGGTGFGGFGSSNTGGGFGSPASGGTGGGLFGSKPAGGGFGTGTGTSGFGTGGGFGATGTTGFGGGTGTAFNQPVPPSDGTGSTPFSPFTDKDASSTQTNHYQSISMMAPYNKYSHEELRLGDYNQGRRFGNGSGQAGAFGSSAFGGSGFGQQSTGGGFGSTASPFGGGTSAPSAFGQTSTTGGGFGSTGGSSLFGANKPATSLFGGGTTGTSQPGGGLFGSGTSTTGGFGASNTSGTGTGGFGTGTGTGGGLFGSNNQQQQQQNKPLFGGTGATGSTGTGFGGFGSQTTSASPFGSTAATSSPFGGGQQQTGTSAFGGFGAQNQNQTQNKPGGGLFGGGGGGFGTNNQQPSTGGGLFGGSTNTGSSLFGQNNQQNQQQNTGSSIFGGGGTQSAGGGLFGNANQQQSQPKPGGLFGSSTTGTGTGASPFGGFGNTQNQSAGTGGSLFGGAAQNNQQPKPSLFGQSTGTGSSLFGGQNNTQGTGSSLFGNTQSQQPQSGGLGGSIFGGSQQPQQQPQAQPPAPGSMQASLLDGNPYGNQSIFSGLPGPSAPSPGPLATPLSSSMKQKQRTPLPVHKITPSASTRLVTPPKRGYGFSYSTYGSPTSSTNSPNGSLLGGGNSMRASVNGSFNRSFSKSFSTSNLRNSFDPSSDSVLSPGALSSGTSRLSSGGLKRLTIDRSLRNDLFARPASTSAAPITNGEDPSAERSKKRVSFDAVASSKQDGGEIVAAGTESPEPTPEELGFLRSIRKSGSMSGTNNVKSSFDAFGRPEMESARNNELPAVPEDSEAVSANGVSKSPATQGGDPQPGEYWMKPSRAEINKMSREQQKSFKGLVVGRWNCGQVTFDEPVDLTTIDLDQIFGGLVEIGLRKITVYPDEAVKPPMGKGLNVPSILRIENSWPRGHKSPSAVNNGRLFDKHIDRLKKVVNAEFIDYVKTTGTWTFKVPHFTTYGLDYDDEDEEEAAGESLNRSALSAAPDTSTPKAQTTANFDQTMDSEPTETFTTDDSFVGSIAGVDDDTFDFKKRKMVPGGFGDQAMEVEEEEEGTVSNGDQDSFLGEGSTGSTAEQEGDDDEVTESQQSGESGVELGEDEEMDMAGAFPNLRPTVERNVSPSADSYMENQPSLKPWNTPSKARLDLSDDWAEQLQRTISPRKQNRDALREIQGNAFNDRTLHDTTPTKRSTIDSQPKGFTNSIDLMNSLFQQPRKQQVQSPLKKHNVQHTGFEWPYNKQPKTFAGDSNELSREDIAFHHSFKPRWGPSDSLITVRNDVREAQSTDNGRWEHGFLLTSENRNVAVLGYNKAPESSEMLDAQKKQSVIKRVDGVPFARLSQVDFRQFTQISSVWAQSDNERLIWQLANVLFNDDIEDDISASVPVQLRRQYASRIKKDRLSRVWEGIVRQKLVQDLERAGSPEERVFYLLCSHRTEEACKELTAGRNFRLATLIAQIGRDRTTRADMAEQVDMWRQHSVLSEMSEPVRALYELLAGNALHSEGKSHGALEDRASTFTFTERFELDWFQAFGLRLWYSITDDEPVEAAVSKFIDDLTSGSEPAFPSPSATGVMHTTPDTLGRESPLWVLIKLYSAVFTNGARISGLEFPAALLPESVSGDRLSNRLSFQLHQLFAAAVGQQECFKVDTAQADQLTRDYAWELSVASQLENAMFVLLHLSKAPERERAIKEALALFAPQLPDAVTADGSPNAVWQYLSSGLQIPEAWIWVAKALYARDGGDAAREVECLIRGKNWNDAHGTFCRIVGPTAVIERDYATLENLISGFGDGPERKVRGWAGGGGIYEDFLRLATAKGGKRDPNRLNRLVNALVTMGEKIGKSSSVEGLEERVAFKEMSRAVAGWATAQEDANAVELSNVLSLPLTGDARLMQTAEMSRRYYSVIMAGGY